MTPRLDIATESGIVRGRRDGRVATWRAVPYAAPPVGDLRLRSPARIAAWTGIRDAREFRDAALSHPFSSPLGLLERQRQSEDCLTLNVCAPIDLGAPRPVLVFVHGGGFFEGSSAWPLYDPRPLVDRGDVVLVSINYRLNAFGFIDFSKYSTPDRPFESNLGLRDQVAALEWVQRNIAAFGGDPHNVTLFGESAGGACVVDLMTVPAAEGLFHRVIAQSAPADAVCSPESAAAVADACIANLGATPETAASALQNSSARTIVRAALKLLHPMMSQVPGRMPFVPVVDGEFLPEEPLAAFANGRAHRVPMIIGTNRNELDLHGRLIDVLPSKDRLIDRMFAATNPAVQRDILAAYEHLPGRPGALQFGTDSFFLRPTLAACEAHQAYAPTYVYRFDYATPLLRLTRVGAFHGFELLAVFGVVYKWLPRLLAIGARATFRAVSEETQDHWLSFAKTGAPLSHWPAYTEAERATLLIDESSRVVCDLDPDIRAALSTYDGPYRTLTAG